MRKVKQINFRFRAGMTVGQIDAVLDQMLEEAWVDTGELSALVDTSNPKSIVVGRTGSGKTALLLRLTRSRSHVIRVNPDALSMQYLSNSTVLPRLAEAGVHLEPFYRFLWRHVFVMELIRERYGSPDKATNQGLLDRILTAVGSNRAQREAIEYYRSWSPTLWESTECRVREITKTLNDRIAAEVGLESLGLGTKVEHGGETKVRDEVKQRAQAIVNQLSVQHMRVGLELVRERILTDNQKPYYIVLDDLDVNWVDDRFAYDLIDALIDAAGAFAELQNVKIVVALREDIVDTLHARHGSMAQQREKQEALFQRVRWTNSQLRELIDRRLGLLLKGQYGGEVSLQSLLPPEHPKRGNAIEFIMKRTLQRPRDVIDFVNKALGAAAAKGSTKISWEILDEAERIYSTTRLRSLEDEWDGRFPGLQAIFGALRGAADGFTLDQLEDDRLVKICIEGERMLQNGLRGLPVLAFEMQEASQSVEVWAVLVTALVRIGFLGIKKSPEAPVRFSYESHDLASSADETGVVFYFHPAVCSELGIRGSPRTG